jgi:hypothetical protein
MEGRQAAQAVQLIGALRAQLNEMTARLAWVERTGATTKKRSVVSAMRCEAAELRRDIDEARILIDGLCSRYLGGTMPAPNTTRHPASGAFVTRQQAERPSRSVR